jgi:Thaumarchaeal output domain 1
MTTDTAHALTEKSNRPLAASANTVHDADAAPTIERRAEKPRVRFPRPLVIVPVLPDGSPDWEHRAVGVPMDLTHDGEVELQWDSNTELATTSLIALVQTADGALSAAGIDVEAVRHREGAGTLVIGRLGGFGEELLNPAKLTPTFDPETLTCQLGFAEEILDRWAAIGVLEAVFVDKVRVCPRCQSLPTFRSGCPNCGSAHLENDQLIHHFACAHVGRATDFERDGDLICPKCRTRRLVVASDFDYVTGPHRCLACHWSNLQLEDVAQCLRCQFRFPAYQAHTKELRGFRADRLDPLADLPTS